jgi:predicted SprT family Zn-dependent metalloprotease
MKDYVIFTQENFIARVRMCIQLLSTELGVKLNFDIPISISNMSKCLGYFQSQGKKSLKLNFSSTLLDGRYTLRFVEDTIKHETCHYLLFEMTKVSHKHDYMFKDMCRRVGCNGSAKIKAELSSLGRELVEDSKVNSKYVVKCLKCGNMSYYDKEIKVVKYTHLYRCKCGSCLELIKN